MNLGQIKNLALITLWIAPIIMLSVGLLSCGKHTGSPSFMNPDNIAPITLDYIRAWCLTEDDEIEIIIGSPLDDLDNIYALITLPEEEQFEEKNIEVDDSIEGSKIFENENYRLTINLLSYSDSTYQYEAEAEDLGNEEVFQLSCRLLDEE